MSNEGIIYGGSVWVNQQIKDLVEEEYNDQ